MINEAVTRFPKTSAIELGFYADCPVDHIARKES